MKMKRTFPPGTVVRFSDDHEPNGTVEMKLTISMPGEPEPEMETALTEHLVIIGWCDRDGHMTWA